MVRSLFVIGLATCLLLFQAAQAQDDGPPIVIKSPDEATTYPYASIKEHALLWDRKSGQLLAHIVFTPVDPNDASDEDSHDFRLPGVTFDEKKGLFFATSAKGDVIPVARIKKTLFLKSVEPLPNTNVRIEHPHGNVSVVLEAIDPHDPAMHPPPAPESPDGETVGDPNHTVDIHNLLH
jgi:hypothetical protein